MQKNFYSELKSAFEHSPIPFAVLDRDMHIVYLNNALFKRYGDLTDTVKLYMLFEDVDKETIVNYLKSEKNYELICDLPDKKGAHIYLSALFESESGEFIGATATLPKLAESREDMLSYIDENDYQMAINRELRDRVSMMFSSVYALSNTSELDKSPRVCEFINSINQNCYQLLRVSDNLARITRLSAKNDYASFELIDLCEFMKTLIATVVHLDNKERVPIHFDCPHNIIPARLDLSRMEFAIVNILLNSIKYTRDGNRIDVSLKTIGNNAVISISDRGVGIPKDILHLVGTPYFSYSHGDRFEAGFGISLYIAKKYIASHGGNFVIQSTEGKGTTVTISLPIDLDEDMSSRSFSLHASSNFDPNGKFSQTRIQLSEVCYYPTM